MSDRPYSRRGFLLSLGVAGAASAALTACGGRTDTAPGTQTTQPAPATTAPGAPAGSEGVVAAECPGYADLSEEQISVRRTLNYVDQSPQAGQYCYNCRFVIENGEYGNCQGCQLFAGPVAPQGWCSSWAAMT
jgi:hypothetical protein